MRVELLHNTPLYIASKAIRTCWQSQEKSDTIHTCPECGSTEDVICCGAETELVCGPNDKALIDRVGNKFKHSSTLEHLTYSFYISGVSRALLQELARHRMASPSVKSTRYTLKELKDEEPFLSDEFMPMSQLNGSGSLNRAAKYLVYTGIPRVDLSSIIALDNLRIALVEGISNDKAKYCLPESYKTELTWTINARSLQNFLTLRSSKAALWEIRDLANMVYENLPDEHKYLFEDSICEINEVK